MLVIYDKETGGINYTIDKHTDPNIIEVEEDEKIFVTQVEHGTNIMGLRMDINSDPPQLVEKTSIILTADKEEIILGETINMSVKCEGEKIEEQITLTINGESIQIPFMNDTYPLKLETPGQYVIEIPDNRYYSRPLLVEVKEGA